MVRLMFLCKTYVFKCFVTAKQQWQECRFITLPNTVKHSKYVAFENTRMTSFSPQSSDIFLPGSESGNSIQQKIYQQSWILPRYVWDGCKAFPVPHACITASCCSHSSTLHTRSMAFFRAGMNPSLMNIFKEGIGFAEVPTFHKNLFHYQKLQESFWDPQARLLLQVMQLTFLRQNWWLQ